ncbi:hypothetical protein J6TS7_35110 [Paenibacillus dendritiformis]|nr:hypothetical protein J6TS7_35110 [Paenibacillus dendritiformis]
MRVIPLRAAQGVFELVQIMVISACMNRGERAAWRLHAKMGRMVALTGEGW